ncbi:MAG: S41 family peptidase [Chloroflexota bacterium]
MQKHIQFLLYALGSLFLLLLAFGLGFYSYPLITPAGTLPAQVGSFSAESDGGPQDDGIADSGEGSGDAPNSSSGGASEATSVSLSEGVTDDSTNDTAEVPTEATADQTDVDLTGIPAEELALLADAWRTLNREFFGEKPLPREQTYGSLRGLLQAYDDPYTFFIVPETNEVEKGNLQGRFGGIGAQIGLSDAGYRLTPLRDNPAERAGIQDGDILIQVDETEISKETSSDEVIALIRGPLDTEVTLGILRLPKGETDLSSAEALAVTIVRGEIQTPSMEWRLLTPADIPEERLDELNLDGNKISQIGYIQHHTYSDRSPSEMALAINELLEGGADRFILDLRGNPGGPVKAVIDVTDLWMDSGIIMQEEKADGTEKLFAAKMDSQISSEPAVIILDGGSASASEIFAGALRDNQRATLLGEKSFGKGSVQIIHGLPDGSSMHITNALWFTPNGHKIDGQGLTPDILIEQGSDFLHEAILYILAE